MLHGALPGGFFVDDGTAGEHFDENERHLVDVHGGCDDLSLDVFRGQVLGGAEDHAGLGKAAVQATAHVGDAEIDDFQGFLARVGAI